jgi:enoyl-CoA hydratase/carnithine racemase
MPVLCEKRGRVGIITLSRPEARNCWGADFNEGIVEHAEALAADDDIGAVVLTGDEQGGAFSAGANLKDPRTHRTDATAEFIRSLPQWKNFAGNILAELPKPVIAAVNGYAVGIGCIITCCCDLIVASERAEWRMPQVALGLIPNHGGAVRMARWIGRGHAMKLALGFPLAAEEAFRIGLAQWLVPHARLEEEALAVAGRLADMPPLALQLAKESLVRGLDIPNLRDASFGDLYRFMALSQTEDAKESHAAWRERRPPKRRGR